MMLVTNTVGLLPRRPGLLHLVSRNIISVALCTMRGMGTLSLFISY